MKGYIGVTDDDWFRFLSSVPQIDEVNFWQPGGNSQFKSLQPGEPFFFKLHSPLNYIVGGGFFAHSTILPVSLAWQAFGIKNGATSFIEMRKRIEKYRRTAPSTVDYRIGCIILTDPFFFSEDAWISVPYDFSLNIVQGKTYNLHQGEGLRLWRQIQDRLSSHSFGIKLPKGIAFPETQYGNPVLITPRLGQGGFRIAVTDAYQRRCAITQEKTLPALEAAHIKPYSENGPHEVVNGVLFRSDIHRLFDTGYVTVSPDLHFKVSKRIREEFENGRDYYAFHGTRIHVPASSRLLPNREYLSWHNQNIFKG